MTTLELYGTEAEIERLLAETRTWAIVGLGSDPTRPAFAVSRFLQQLGKRIVPVHPRAETVHGEQGYATLADIPFPVDVVDYFVRADRVGPLVDDALALDPKPLAIWMQLTVVDEAAAQRARDAGLITVMNHCPAIEWRDHGPRA